MAHCYLGLDLGKRRDPSAVAIVEREEPAFHRLDYVAYLRGQEKLEAKFAVRHLERVPLHTSYVLVAEKVRQMVRTPELRGRCTVVVDAGGVGEAVLDLLRDGRMDCPVVPVMITGGTRVRCESGVWNVPKRDLIAALQVLLEQKRLTIAADLPGAKALVDEMMSMRARVTPAGNEQMGAWKAGTHDDLALAVAMACWRAKGDERGVGERADGRLV